MILAAILLGASSVSLVTPPLATSDTSEQQQVDFYFDHPRNVATLRALSGMGDPHIEEANSYAPYGYDRDDPLQKALFEGLNGQDPAYLSIGDCRIDYAMKVGHARENQLGPNHPYFAQWIKVQRAVFAACADGQHTTGDPLPPPMVLKSPKLAHLQAQDRAYQEASLLFYRKDPDARQAFARIAASRSPHAHVARYMLAASSVPNSWRIQPEEWRDGLRKAEAILADPALVDIHPLAQGFIGALGSWSGDAEVRRVQVRLTLKALEQPTAALSDPIPGDLYARSAADIDKLHSHFPDPDWWLTGKIPDEYTASRAMAAEARHDAFAQWLLFDRSPFEVEPWVLRGNAPLSGPWAALRAKAASHDQAGALQWDAVLLSLQTRYDPAGWRRCDSLLARIDHAPDDKVLALLPLLFFHQVRTALVYPSPRDRKVAFRTFMEEAEKWPWKDDFVFQRVMSEAVRYLASSGRLEEARELRDRSWVPSGSYNGAVLLLLAEDEDHAAAVIASGDDTPAFMNYLSVSNLARLASRNDIPREKRALFARVAWTRIYARGLQVPRNLDRLMRDLNPESTNWWSSQPGASPSSHKLLLDVLSSPAMNILITDHDRHASEDPNEAGLDRLDLYEHSDNNWWCAWQPERHRQAAAQWMYNVFFASNEEWDDEHRPTASEIEATPERLGLLLGSSWVWQGQDVLEQQALSGIDSAPKLLSERAIQWTRHASYLSVKAPATLGLAVLSTRYGCQRQGGHGAYSRAAFELLHERYPLSLAAHKTPYWFDCAHFYGGCPAKKEDEVQPDQG